MCKLLLYGYINVPNAAYTWKKVYMPILNLYKFICELCVMCKLLLYCYINIPNECLPSISSFYLFFS